MKQELLYEVVRSFFESRRGEEFSGDRMHTDAQSSRLARFIKAQASTYGSGIVFGCGQYASNTEQGKALLAHEPAYAVKQRGRSVTVQRQPETPSDDQTLTYLPAGGMRLKVEPYADADNFPGDTVQSGDAVVVRNTGYASTYRNVRNRAWSWIEVPVKSSPDPNYPLLYGMYSK